MYKTKTGKYKATSKATPTSKKKALKQFRAYKANSRSGKATPTPGKTRRKP